MSVARHHSAADTEPRLTPMEDAAKRRLASHSLFFNSADRFTFDFDPSSGVLSVHGTVSSFYLKQLVQIILKGLSGVARVDNRVQVGAAAAATSRRRSPSLQRRPHGR